jgi:CRP/FNR family cyclic AMP-dependent transcriptional regulator
MAGPKAEFQARSYHMDNILLLVKVFFFKELSPEELVKVALIVQNRSYHIGRKVFEAASASDSFYVIKSGSVMVKQGPMVLATPGVGDPVGEMSFMDREPRSATVVAIEDTELLRISFDDLEQLLLSEPAMAAKIYKAIALVLSHRLREMQASISTRFQPKEVVN